MDEEEEEEEERSSLPDPRLPQLAHFPFFPLDGLLRQKYPFYFTLPQQRFGQEL